MSLYLYRIPKKVLLAMHKLGAIEAGCSMFSDGTVWTHTVHFFDATQREVGNWSDLYRDANLFETFEAPHRIWHPNYLMMREVERLDLVDLGIELPRWTSRRHSDDDWSIIDPQGIQHLRGLSMTEADNVVAGCNDSSQQCGECGEVSRSLLEGRS